MVALGPDDVVDIMRNLTVNLAVAVVLPETVNMRGGRLNPRLLWLDLCIYTLCNDLSRYRRFGVLRGVGSVDFDSEKTNGHGRRFCLASFSSSQSSQQPLRCSSFALLFSALPLWLSFALLSSPRCPLAETSLFLPRATTPTLSPPALSRLLPEASVLLVASTTDQPLPLVVAGTLRLTPYSEVRCWFFAFPTFSDALTLNFFAVPLGGIVSASVPPFFFLGHRTGTINFRFVGCFWRGP